MKTRRAGDVSQARLVRPYRDRHERSVGRGGTIAVASAQEAGQARPRARAVLAVNPARGARRRAAGVPDPSPAHVPLAGPQRVDRDGSADHEPAVGARTLDRDPGVVANPGRPVGAEHGSAVPRGEVAVTCLGNGASPTIGSARARPSRPGPVSGFRWGTAAHCVRSSRTRPRRGRHRACPRAW